MAGGIVPVTVAAAVCFVVVHVSQSFVLDADAVAGVDAVEEVAMTSMDMPKEEIAMACELNSSICSTASGFEESAHMFTTYAMAFSTSVYSSIPPLKYAWLITQV